jgi:putative ABC transport system ATP-binding protein
LELREVVKHFPISGEVVRAVDGVSLRVDAGELVALYGPSGAGKTTLLMLAAAIMAPDSGSVWFGERELSRLSERESARYRLTEVGLVFQSSHLMGGASALDNAALKLLGAGQDPKAAAKAAKPWLERVGLRKRAAHTPGRLSMGERQRVAIARALANEPSLVLADEPTGNLDTRRGREILAMLRDIGRERRIPILVVTHDPQAAGFADRVHTLRDGRLSDGIDVDLALPVESA